jgi:hypothetical protein
MDRHLSSGGLILLRLGGVWLSSKLQFGEHDTFAKLCNVLTSQKVRT